MIGYLIASQIVLWIAVIVLGAVCIALARQVGLLHERIAPAGALMLPGRTLNVGDTAPVMSLALMSRFASQGHDEYASRLLAMMRKGFGGHAVANEEDVK